MNEQMKPIFTSCWAGYQGPGRIGISRGNPRFGVPAGYRTYKALAPTWDILKTCTEKADYERRFNREVLGILDANQVVNDLRRLAGDHPPVLLCFEKLPFTETNWCHRTMVAKWITHETGIVVDEMGDRHDHATQKSLSLSA